MPSNHKKPRNLRRRSGRSWLFRNFKRAAILFLVATLYAWYWSPNGWIYHVGDSLTLGLAKGTFDLMLLTGDTKGPAFAPFITPALDDPSFSFRPNLYDDYRKKPSGWFSGTFAVDAQTPPAYPAERLGLHFIHYRSVYYPALMSGYGAATVRNVQLPCWLVTLALLVVCAINFFLDRPIPEDVCPTCHYNLTANTSGICPECGKPCQTANA
jgi:hypothetical protein